MPHACVASPFTASSPLAQRLEETIRSIAHARRYSPTIDEEVLLPSLEVELVAFERALYLDAPEAPCTFQCPSRPSRDAPWSSLGAKKRPQKASPRIECLRARSPALSLN